MRTALFGSEISLSKGSFVGCNLGYNFVCEHEQGTVRLVNYINMDSTEILNKINELGLSGVKATMKANKMVKEANKLLARWNNTPFSGYILSPYAPTFIKNIRILNDGIKGKYPKLLLDNDDYTVFYIASSFVMNSHKERLGKKKIFSEDEVLHTVDYCTSLISNVGYWLNGGKAEMGSHSDFIAEWADDGIMILIKSSLEKKLGVIESLSSAIKRGCLAVVPEEPRLFKDRGCCLVILDVGYGV